jgi:hypothetical protein
VLQDLARLNAGGSYCQKRKTSNKKQASLENEKHNCNIALLYHHEKNYSATRL